MEQTAATPGIDADGIARWLSEHTEVSPPLSFRLVAGGRSNMTYEMSDAEGRRWALRRPPLHSVLPSAHDMNREHRVIAALHGTAVPVPEPVALCEDPEVTGAPFYVMDFVDGLVLRSKEDAERELDADARRHAGERLVDVLAELHAIDPDEVGLSHHGRRESYLERQLRRWQGQWEAVKTEPVPALEQAHEAISRNIPEQQGAAIVHGDYRLDNMIVNGRGEPLAVLDWELSTLGDPLADVGLLMVYWEGPYGSFPTQAPGFPSREEAAERYAQRSGRDLSTLDTYVAFACWKLAVVLQGVHARDVAGAYGDRKPDEMLPRAVERLAEEAARLSPS